MKKDKNGHLHDHAGRFAPKPRVKPVNISLGSQINIALLVVLGVDVSITFFMYVWPNVVSTFDALYALL